MPSNNQLQNALLIMAKRPFPGHTKTRLTPFLTEQQAAELYASFLQDVLDKVAHLPDVAPYVAFAPETAVSYFQEIAPYFGLVPQTGETLGDRLDYVLTACQQYGHQRVAAMNSDSPNLPPEYLSEAFHLLEDRSVDVVLGPCEDGGYYLIGWKRPYPALVRDVQMSTPDVLKDTLEIANKLSLKVALLPEWYDVDSECELKRLAKELQNNTTHSPHTLNYLKNLNL